ncbi:hypothetical protein FACS1894125_3750 [Actinomycetota bacterium]|nr:hypothetical protein FACS1894125_3750 [Actinomycetota bacterium]
MRSDSRSVRDPATKAQSLSQTRFGNDIRDVGPATSAGKGALKNIGLVLVGFVPTLLLTLGIGLVAGWWQWKGGLDMTFLVQ